MSSACHPGHWPAVRALWLLLCATALPQLADKSCCDALKAVTPPSSSIVEEGNDVDGERNPHQRDDIAPERDGEARFGDQFFQCYKDSKDSALSCLGASAEAGLSSFFSKENLHVSEGLTLVKKEKEEDDEGREVPDDVDMGFDGQHRTVIDSAAAYLSARAIRWDMSGLYPGLIMRVGPTLTGTGVLEFVMEPRKYYNDRQLGPSRMLLKQVVLPFLLGVKVSVASLVPLLLFAVVFLAKKALLMSQLSALVSGIMGFGAYGYGHPHAHGHGFGGGLDGGGAGILGNPLAPVRSSHALGSPLGQPQHDGGPQILHLGGGAPIGGSVAAPAWLGQAHQLHHPFRGVNYDFRDERHGSGGDPGRGTRGFRWEAAPHHPEPPARGDTGTIETLRRRGERITVEPRERGW